MPNLHISLRKFKHNLDYLISLCHNKSIRLMGVSKVFCADEKLVQIMSDSNLDYIADSRIENLMKIKTTKPKVMLRLPSIDEVDKVITHADISLNSELDTIMALDEAAAKQHKKHQIILMFDIGDLREGIYYKDFDLDIIDDIMKLKYINLLGIGTNLTCYGGVIPTKTIYEKLETIKTKIESTYNIKLLTSGGNSSSLPLLMTDELPKFIDNLRLGEAIVLGRETAYGEQIDNLYDDVFTLNANIIEIKDKPTLPEGELGFNAFGEKVAFVDRGIIKHAILNVGKQDVDPNDLIPDKDIKILGASSDHLIIELLDPNLKLGDQVAFKLTYGGILRLATSPYVKKTYEEL